MGVRASTPEFAAAFAMDICLNVFCQGHKPAAQFGGADMPNKVASELTPEKMIQHGMHPIKQQTAKYPSTGSDVYKCLKWVGAYINEMTTEIAAGNIKKQVHDLTTQAKFWEALGKTTTQQPTLPKATKAKPPTKAKPTTKGKQTTTAKQTTKPTKAVSKPLPFNQQHAHQRTTRATTRANRGNNQADNATTPNQMEGTTTQATKRKLQ